MPPSSLVFVAIVVGWAAYLLPKWVVRREALGESRGRDRHSQHLRVLPRRRRRPGGASSAPLLASGSTGLSGSQSASGSASVGRSGTSSGQSSMPPEVGSVRRPDGSAARRAATRRVRVLIVLSALTALCWTAVAFDAAPRWVATPASALLALDLLALTVTGRRRAAGRRALARETARRSIRAGRRPGAASARVSLAAASTLATAGVAGAAPASTTPAERRLADRRGAERRTAERRAVASASSRVRSLVGDAAARVSTVAAPVDDGTWLPIAVPPPTYTLKPVVARAAPRPLDPSAVAPAADPRSWPQERSWADDLDLDAVLARRRAVNG